MSLKSYLQVDQSYRKLPPTRIYRQSTDLRHRIGRSPSHRQKRARKQRLNGSSACHSVVQRAAAVGRRTCLIGAFVLRGIQSVVVGVAAAVGTIGCELVGAEIGVSADPVPVRIIWIRAARVVGIAKFVPDNYPRYLARHHRQNPPVRRWRSVWWATLRRPSARG